jgi:uncharacterized protein (TIGR04255 family)
MGKKYGKPPIVEALCEFHFEPDAVWDLVMPGLAYEELRSHFPKREPWRVLDVEGRDIGFPYSDAIRFLREDEKAAILVGASVLSVSHLKPYPTWEEFLPMIKQGFDAYRKVVGPKSLRSVDLRYINEMEVWGGFENLQSYFNLRPFVGMSLPRETDTFIAGIQIPYAESRDILKVEIRGSGSEENGPIRATLDLDYVLLEPEKIELESIFDWVEVAHGNVEEAFEACLTESLKQTFEEMEK